MYLAIILLPLFGSIVAGFFGRKVGISGAQIITSTCVIVTTILAIVAFFEVGLNDISVSIDLFRWIDSESLNVSWGFNYDSLTCAILLPILIVSSLVHLYSIGYMSQDPHNQRFFSYLSLFTFMMIILVTANNFLLMFVGWEGVGICSYLLVNFWFTRIAANQSALTALLTNRVGDCFLTIGMFAIVWSVGNVDFASVFSLAPFVNENVVTFICICLFIGAMAKSSQIGLHVWLPMAMEGPTPVSALIHAATMVTAGVYLLMRASPLMEYSSTALILCLWVGAFTTVFSSLIGLFQQDIKKVVAYSTMSQLGMMVIAVGLSSYNVGLYHLVNHAFYKALLFLGAGSVIHAVGDNQDLRKYGGLRRYMPLTYSVILIASMSLVAFPFMTGFYSKDFILESAYGQFTFSGTVVYFIATIGAMFTTLYSVKVLYLTFLTNPNGAKHNYYITEPRVIDGYRVFHYPKDSFNGLKGTELVIHPISVELRSDISYLKRSIISSRTTNKIILLQIKERELLIFTNSNSWRRFEDEYWNLNDYPEFEREVPQLEEGRIEFERLPIDKVTSLAEVRCVTYSEKLTRYIEEIIILREEYAYNNTEKGKAKLQLCSKLKEQSNNYKELRQNIDIQKAKINEEYNRYKELYTKLKDRLCHEGDIFMTLPLIVLAVFSIFFGYITKDIFIGLGSGFFAGDNSIFIHPTHEIMLDTEFAVPTIFKLLPLIFTITLSILAIVMSEFSFFQKILIKFKLSRLGYNIFGFFNQRFLIEMFYNKYITNLVLKLGDQTTKVLDKGCVEYLGPFGFKKLFLSLSEYLASLSSGLVITKYALYILICLIIFFGIFAYILQYRALRSIPIAQSIDISLFLLFCLCLLSLSNNNKIATNNSSTSLLYRPLITNKYHYRLPVLLASEQKRRCFSTSHTKMIKRTIGESVISNNKRPKGEAESDFTPLSKKEIYDKLTNTAPAKHTPYTIPNFEEVYRELKNKTADDRDDYYDCAWEKVEESSKKSIYDSERRVRVKDWLKSGLSTFTKKPKVVAEPDLRRHLARKYYIEEVKKEYRLILAKQQGQIENKIDEDNSRLATLLTAFKPSKLSSISKFIRPFITSIIELLARIIPFIITIFLFKWVYLLDILNPILSLLPLNSPYMLLISKIIPVCYEQWRHYCRIKKISQFFIKIYNFFAERRKKK